MGGLFPTNNGPSEADIAYQQTDAGWAAQQASWARQRASMSPADAAAFDARNDQYAQTNMLGPYSRAAIAARLAPPSLTDQAVRAGGFAASIRARLGQGRAAALALGDGTFLNQDINPGAATTLPPPATPDVVDKGPATYAPGTGPKALTSAPKAPTSTSPIDGEWQPLRQRIQSRLGGRQP